MLRVLLATLRAQPLAATDTLVFLGDYIDRGEDSRAVVETLLALQAERPNTVFLRGNHEQMLLGACDGPPSELDPDPNYILHAEPTALWLQNGGMETLDSYEAGDFLRWREAIPDAHWNFFRKTGFEFVTERHHFVHAGLLPPGRNWPASRDGLDYRLWIREPFLSSRADFDGRVVVFGHTPQSSGLPLVQRNKIGLDTGAVYGGPLTAGVFPSACSDWRLPPPLFLRAEYAVRKPA